jgi:hypothetical protein
MPIKILIVIAFLVIIYSLATALFYLVKHKDSDIEASRKMAKALTWRIGLSVTLFLLIALAYAFGLIKPQGIGARMQQVRFEQQAGQNQ